MDKKIEMRVNLTNLLVAAAREMQSPGITIGFQVASARLAKIADRAIEIGDETILHQLKLLDLVEEN
jgi:hypothetical protein